MPGLASRIPVGYGLAIASWSITGDAEPQTVTWGFTDDGATAPNTIATNMSTRWLVPFAAGNLTTVMTYRGIVVYVNRGGTIARGDAVASTVGTFAAVPVSSALALIVKKRTATVGKRYRGRFYLPGGLINRADVDQNGTIAGAAVTTWQTRMSNWLTAEIATVFDPVIIHAAALATAPTPITTLVVASQLGVQRQRMR